MLGRVAGTTYDLSNLWSIGDELFCEVSVLQYFYFKVHQPILSMYVFLVLHIQESFVCTQLCRVGKLMDELCVHCRRI